MLKQQQLKLPLASYGVLPGNKSGYFMDSHHKQ
jgi:hypothetical protein